MGSGEAREEAVKGLGSDCVFCLGGEHEGDEGLEASERWIWALGSELVTAVDVHGGLEL